MRIPWFICSSLLAATLVAAGNVPLAYADSKTTAAREVVEYLLRTFGFKAVAEGTETLAKRIALTATRHGDDVFNAVKRIGPGALSLADDAAENAPRVMRFIAKHGDGAAALMNKQSMKLLSLGDDAGLALLRHKAVAVPLLESYGSTAVRALASLTERNGRRLAMLAKGFDQVQQTKSMVELVARYGNKVVDWMWDHKGVLVTAAACTAFLSDPEGFMNGTRSLTETVAREVVVPVSTVVVGGGVKLGESVLQHAVKPAVTEMSKAAAGHIPWGTVGIIGLVSVVGLVAVPVWRLRSLRRAASCVAPPEHPAAA